MGARQPKAAAKRCVLSDRHRNLWQTGVPLPSAAGGAFEGVAARESQPGRRHGSECTTLFRGAEIRLHKPLLSDGLPMGEPVGEARAPHATAAPPLLAPPARPPGAARRLPAAPGLQSPPPPLRPPPAAPPPAAPAAAPWQPPAHTLPPASAIHLSLSDAPSARWATSCHPLPEAAASAVRRLKQSSCPECAFEGPRALLDELHHDSKSAVLWFYVSCAAPGSGLVTIV